jgi:hypothetical protein
MAKFLPRQAEEGAGERVRAIAGGDDDGNIMIWGFRHQR